MIGLLFIRELVRHLRFMPHSFRKRPAPLVVENLCGPVPFVAGTGSWQRFHPRGPRTSNYIGGLSNCKGTIMQLICWM